MPTTSSSTTSNKDHVLALYHQQTVKELFDEYAETFDDHLQHGLRYNVPTLLHECWTRHVAVVAPAELAADQKPIQRCLDLGCGTGLAGAVFRPDCVYLEGVDLSKNMCRQATRKGIYDRVVCDTLLSHMMTQPAATWDLVVSADVFMYVLDVAAVLAQVDRLLLPAGWCVFSTESLADDAEHAWTRRASERFAHQRPYILDMADALRWNLHSVTSVVLRMDEEKPVLGDIFVYQKRFLTDARK